MSYRIIGIMTGNSMDAIDLVLTEFDGRNMRDICAYSTPFSTQMQRSTENLRQAVFNKCKSEIMQIPEFILWHNEYIRNVADTVNKMCEKYQLDKSTIDAIGFHGKTLDHNPPSKAQKEGTKPYTLQAGSGKMLADMTDIKVIYDFRSDAIMQGFEGAPLVPTHNAHISLFEGNGIYYNGGNTSNFAVINNNKAQIAADAGPFNEYIDNFMRQNFDLPFDIDGKIGKKGKINPNLLNKLFQFGQDYYNLDLPKSGDPAYYHKNEIFAYIAQQPINKDDVVYNLEYFAAYVAVLALSKIPDNIILPPQIILFGGGWKNPVVQDAFVNLLNNNSFVLAQHQNDFAKLQKRFATHPQIRYSDLGQNMEARLFGDLARYYLDKKSWEMPEFEKCNCDIILGRATTPDKTRFDKWQQHQDETVKVYDDLICRAAK